MMSYNYISGNSNVLTEPAAKSCLSSKLQQCHIGPSTVPTPPNFTPFKKPPACEFNFRTPNFFYPSQHTHSFKTSAIPHIKSRGHRSTERNVSFDETFKTTTPKVNIIKHEAPMSKHVSFDDSAMNQPMRTSQLPKSPLVGDGHKGPMTPPKPAYFSPQNQSVHNAPGKLREEHSFKGPSAGMKPGENQSFYQESSFSTMTTTTSKSSTGTQSEFTTPSFNPPNNSPNTPPFNPQNNSPNTPPFNPQNNSPNTPYITSTFKQPNLSTPKMNYTDRNLSPVPFGTHNRNPSPVRHVNSSKGVPLSTSPSAKIPPPPPPPPKNGPTQRPDLRVQPPFGYINKSAHSLEPKLPEMPFIPMEYNEMTPVVKETHPGEPIYLSNGEIIPSDTKVMVKDQNAWYKQMSKTIHGLKGDMPMNRACSWSNP